MIEVLLSCVLLVQIDNELPVHGHATIIHHPDDMGAKMINSHAQLLHGFRVFAFDLLVLVLSFPFHASIKHHIACTFVLAFFLENLINSVGCTLV